MCAAARRADCTDRLLSDSRVPVVWCESSSNVQERKQSQVPGHSFVSVAINNLLKLAQLAFIVKSLSIKHHFFVRGKAD